jgi:hypothetical protein
VTYNLEGLIAAYKVGLRRSEAARVRGGTHRYGWKPSTNSQRYVDGMSAAAEWMIAEATGREWLSNGLVPDPSSEDVSGGISVRWTERDNGSLIIHPHDDAPYSALVTGDNWNLRVRGYIHTEVGKNKNFWRDDVRSPAYFVPQHQLLPITELRLGS